MSCNHGKDPYQWSLKLPCRSCSGDILFIAVSYLTLFNTRKIIIWQVCKWILNSFFWIISLLVRLHMFLVRYSFTFSTATVNMMLQFWFFAEWLPLRIWKGQLFIYSHPFLLCMPYRNSPLQIWILNPPLFSHCCLNLSLCMLNVHYYLAIANLFLLFKLIMPCFQKGLHVSASISLPVTFLLLWCFFFLVLF